MPSKKTKTGSLSEWTIVADRFKTRICRSWDESGECEYMARCMFAHGPQELRTAEQNVAAGLVNPTAVRAYQRHQAKIAKARRLSSSEGSVIEASSASSSDACLPTPPPSSCLVSAPLPHEPSHHEHELSYMHHHEAQMHASSPAFAGHYHPSYSHGGYQAPPPGYHLYSPEEERLRSLAYPHNHAPSPRSLPPPHQRCLLQHGHPHHEHNHPPHQQQQQPHQQQQRQDSATGYNTQEGMYPEDERCPADHFCTGLALPPPPFPTHATSTPPTPPYTHNTYSDFAPAPTVNTAPPPGYNALHPSNSTMSMPPMPPFNNHHHDHRVRKVNASAIADPHRQYGLQGGLVHPKGHPHGRAPDGSMCRCLECVQAHFAAKVVSDDRHEAAVDASVAEESEAKQTVTRKMKARRNGHQPHVVTA